jgi:TolC family type I secretion outer membrane protein
MRALLIAAPLVALASAAPENAAADPLQSPILSAEAAARESGIPPTPRPSTVAPVADLPAPGGPNAAVPAPVRTLAEAVALAARSSPRLEAQRAAARASDERVPIARGAYGPTVQVQGSYSLTHDRNDGQPPFVPPVDESGWTRSAAAILTQPLLTFGRNHAGEAIARAQSRFAGEQLRIVENDVLLNAVAAYVAVVRDANALAIARQNAAILARELEDDTSRYAAHEITMTDLLQVRNRHAAAEGALVQAEGQLATSQAQFLRDVGAPPGELAPPDLLAVPVDGIEAAYDLADRGSPVVAAARFREGISRAQLEAARAEWLPRVDFRGTAAVGTLSPYNDFLRTRRLQAELVATVPLVDLQRAPQVAEAHDNNQSDWLLINQARRENRAQVGGAWNQLAATRASLAWYLRAVEAARSAYEDGRIEARAGQRTTIEVLDLARDLLFVQTSYNSALASEYVARASLLAAMGRLDAASLGVAGSEPAGVHAARVGHAGDLPFLTPLLHRLDGLTPARIPRRRQSADGAAEVRIGAPMPLPADAPGLRVDPTTAGRP